MKNKILCGIVVVLSIILILEVSFKKETNFSFEEKKEETEIQPKPEKKENTIKVLDPDSGVISEMPMEEYVIGVVAAEMPASFEEEALKAQAVASRTFAVYKQEHTKERYDVIKGISNQAYNTIEEMQNKWEENFNENYTKIKQVVETTEGEILTFHGETIEAFYFSMSNGYTERCELVFQESLPYIDSVESEWDNESLNNYEVTVSFGKQEFCDALGISCNNITVENIERTDSKRVKSITINGKGFTGVEVRTALKLRSTDFDIVVGDSVEITTRGSGHGVGMSQYGANGMAKDGYKYDAILSHYYQNIEISKI